MAVTSMAALGSSFAAGPGIPPFENRLAGRSSRNYAHLVAASLDARLIDATVSGATTATILDTPQRFGLRRFPPQIESLDPRAAVDLVTITAGGNDLGYIGSMLTAAMAHRLARSALTRPLSRRIRARQQPVPTDTDTGRVADGLVRVVEAAQRRAPGARILLVDYLTLIGPRTTPSSAAPFTDAELARFRETARCLEAAFERAADGSAAELVRVSASSRDHAIGATEPWVAGFALGPGAATPFHPNAVGMQAVASAIIDHLSPPTMRSTA